MVRGKGEVGAPLGTGPPGVQGKKKGSASHGQCWKIGGQYNAAHARPSAAGASGRLVSCKCICARRGPTAAVGRAKVLGGQHARRGARALGRRLMLAPPLLPRGAAAPLEVAQVSGADGAVHLDVSHIQWRVCAWRRQALDGQVAPGAGAVEGQDLWGRVDGLWGGFCYWFPTTKWLLVACMLQPSPAQAHLLARGPRRARILGVNRVDGDRGVGGGGAGVAVTQAHLQVRDAALAAVVSGRDLDASHLRTCPQVDIPATCRVGGWVRTGRTHAGAE